jgi:hypothetical protein
MGVGVVSTGTDKMIQLNELGRQLSGQVAQRAQQQRDRADATITAIMDNKIESQQQALRSAEQSMKGSRINTYA